MRSLIFGGTGMLGSALVRAARERGWAALALSHRQADVTAAGAIREWIDRFRPEVVFNCAAFTAVDRCEQEAELARRVNAEAVAELATATREAGVRLVHVSTDYVFDGTATRPYREDDPPAPLSVYGATKLDGEVAAAAAPGALVVRASWLFGPGGRSFVTTIVDLLRQRRVPLRVVDDQVGCPTYTPFLARALCELAGRGAEGLVHYRNRDPISWHGFAREIADLWDAGVEVMAVPTAEMPRPARRPAYSVLDVGRYERLTGRKVEPWGWGLAEFLTLLRRGG